MKSLLLIPLLAHAAFAVISLEQYNIESSSLTVSGISSGAAMASQFHVVHSSQVKGAGIFAGVPFGCALGLVAGATDCMLFPSLVSVSGLIARANTMSGSGEIDDTGNLVGSRVHIFHGTEDSVVKPGSGRNVEEFYGHYTSGVKTVFNIGAEHCYPTENYGEACNRLNTVHYMNDCDYNGAYDMLNHLYEGTLAQPLGANTGLLEEFDQSEYFYISSPSLSSMDNIGYAYIPSGCRDKSTPCKLHVAFHGCLQGRELIGNAFAVHGGYLEVAEANNIIVLFPQVIKTLVNPQGCWDWWGYTNNLYDTRSGNQILAVKRMVDRITTGEFQKMSSLNELYV